MTLPELARDWLTADDPALGTDAWIDARAATGLDLLCRLSAINSGSFNADGVDAVGAAIEALLAPLAGPMQRLPLPPLVLTDDRGGRPARVVGPARRVRVRPEAPLQVLLCGHLDTVFGPSHLFQQPQWRDADTLNGPGVADLKGGLLVALLALGALERHPARARIGWELLLIPDEEIGSQSSAPLLVEAASRHRIGLLYEPAYADGGLAGARRGSGNFDLVIEGRAAHAGRNPQQGRNAIALAAELALALHRLNGERAGFSLNLGYSHGGGALNIVPDRAVLKFNVRVAGAEDSAWFEARLAALLATVADRDGFRVEVNGGFTRPPKPTSDAIARLQTLLQACGQRQGLQLAFQPTGGCCDGNNLAAAGLPNVDTLGVVGGELHSDQEWMRASSLAERAKLSAELLTGLASGRYDWA